MTPKKLSPSVVDRFKGKRGATRLGEALLLQPLLGGDKQLAKRIATCVDVVERRKGGRFTRQGDTDNDIYFLLSGSVTVKVNGRKIATRKQGEHVGEMALVDDTAFRSATVIANVTSIAAKLSEERFTKLAIKYPHLWHRVAVMLVQRFRERNKFHKSPHKEPVVFIGSSSEGVRVATCIHDYLQKKPVVSKLWSEGVFEASHTTIEGLMSAVEESDFAIIVLTPDDTTFSRDINRTSPRDNAVFELGLFMGGISRNRTFVIAPRGVDLKIPTDLLGVTLLQYKRGSHGPLSQRLRAVKMKLWKLIEKRGPR